MFALKSLGLLVVGCSYIYLACAIASYPTKNASQESSASSPVPSTVYPAPGLASSQPKFTTFSILVKSPVVVTGEPSVTSLSTLVTVLNQFPSWFCGLEFATVTSDRDAGTYWTWGTLPYICNSGGKFAKGGQGRMAMRVQVLSYRLVDLNTHAVHLQAFVLRLFQHALRATVTSTMILAAGAPTNNNGHESTGDYLVCIFRP